MLEVRSQVVATVMWCCMVGGCVLDRQPQALPDPLPSPTAVGRPAPAPSRGAPPDVPINTGTPPPPAPTVAPPTCERTACEDAPPDTSDTPPSAGDGAPPPPGRPSPGDAPAESSPPVPGPIHRYSFMEAGTTVVDSVGDRDGTLTGGRLDGSGVMQLDGSPGAHAQLPGGLLSALQGATLELWLTWSGGSVDQRALALGTATPSPLTTTDEPDCGSTPTYRKGSWYLICPQGAAWSDARGHCENAGGQLAALGSADEERWLVEQLTAGVWVGANDRVTEGTWGWATAAGDNAGGVFWEGTGDGSAKAGTYANWREYQPDNYGTDGEDCAYLSHDGGALNDNPCEGYWQFACEFRGHQGQANDSGLWFSPDAGGGMAELGLSIAGDTVRVPTPSPPADQVTHVAIAIDPGAATLGLYVNGMPAGSAALTHALSELRDVDAWIGRSHVASHPGYRGSVQELRIFDRVLEDTQIASTYARGPDARFE